MLRLTLLLCVVFVNSLATPNRGINENYGDDLQSYMDEKLKKYKVDLHRTFESARIQQKTDSGHLYGLNSETGLNQEKIKVNQMEDSTARTIADYSVTCWTSLIHQANHFVLVLTENRDLILFNFDGHTFKVILHQTTTERGYKIKAFLHGFDMWFAVAHQTSDQVFYTQMYVYDGQELFKKQIIPSDGRFDFDMVYSRGTWYMGVGSITFSQSGSITLYEWRNTQFDEVAQEKSSGVHSVAVWAEDGLIYLVTAKSSDLDYSMESYLYSFSKRNEDKFTLVQVIPTSQAWKVITFTVEGNRYLVFLTPAGASMYWWAAGEFLELQDISETSGATDVSALQLPNGEAALAISYLDTVDFFAEGYNSKYSLIYRLNRMSGYRVSSTMFFFRPRSYYYLFLTFASDGAPQGPFKPSNVWKLNLSTQFGPDAQKRLDPLISCLSRLNKTVNDHQNDLDAVNSKIERVWVKDRPQVVTATVVVQGSLNIRKELITNQVIIETDQTDIPQVTNSGLKMDILQQRSQLEDAKAEARDIVYGSRDQTISAPVHFTVPPTIQNGHLGMVANDFPLNGVPVSKLSNTVLKSHGDQVLEGELILHDIKTERFDVHGALNGLQPKELFLLNFPTQTVSGKITWNDVTVDSLTMSPGATLNGMNPRDMVLVTGGYQEITGVKTFASLNVKKEIRVRGYTNGRDLSSLSTKVVSIRESSRLVGGDYRFAAPLVVEGDVYVNGLINGHINITKLNEDALSRDDNQLVRGHKVFKHPVYVDGDVTVDGLTNGMDVDQDVMTVDTPQTVPGHFSFDLPLGFGEDLQTGVVNGIDLSEDMVFKGRGPHRLTGKKRLPNSLGVKGDVVMSPGATLNEVDPSELLNSAATEGDFVLSGPTVFQEMSAKYVDFVSVFNGIDLKDIGGRFWRKSKDQEAKIPLTFATPVLFEGDLVVEETVNGMDLERDFVHSFGDELINAPLTFADDVYVESPVTLGPGVKIGGYDLQAANKSIVFSGSPFSEVSGLKHFSSLEVEGDVIVKGRLNGFKPSEDFLLSKRPQTLKGHVNLLSPVNVIGDVITDWIDLKRDINGLDFSEFYLQAVMVDDPRQIPIEYKNFVGQLKALNYNSLGTMSGIDLEHMKRNAIPLSSPGQLILSGFNFSDVEVQGDLDASLINGMVLEQYLPQVVLFGQEEIRGPKTFAGSLTIGGRLDVSGDLSGVDVPSLMARTANKDSNNFTAPVTFVGDISSDSVYISHASVLDGVPWSELVFLKEETSLTGSNLFTEEIVIEGKVSLRNELVNGCDLKKLSDEAVYSDVPDQIILGDVAVGQMMVGGNLNINGQVNEVDVQRLASELVTRNEQQTISGEVRFQSTVKVNKLVLRKNVNQIDLEFLLKDAVYTNIEQVITGSKIFTHPNGAIFDQNLTVTGDVFPNYEVNGVDLSLLHETTVLNIVDATMGGQKTFTDVVVDGDLYIGGMLNGINIPGDLVLARTEEYVPAPIHIVGHTYVQGGLTVLRSIDGVNLEQVVDRRVTLSQHETFTSELNFVDEVRVGNLQVLGTVNDIPMSSVIMQSLDYTVGGHKTILGDVFIEGDFEAPSINSISVPQLEEQVVRYDRKEVVRGPTIFTAPVHVVHDIVVESSLNGIDVGSVDQRLIDYRVKIDVINHQLQEEVRFQELFLRERLHNHYKRGYLVLSYLEIVQTVELPAVKIFSSPSHDLENNGGNTAAVTLFAWSFTECYHKPCCSISTYVLTLDDHGYVAVIPEPHRRRLYPLVFGEHKSFGDLQGFLMWTNSSELECLLPTHEETIILSLHASNSQRSRSEVTFQNQRTSYVIAVELFQIENALYNAVAYREDKSNGHPARVEIHRFDLGLGLWLVHQTLVAEGVSDLDVYFEGVTQMALLVVGARFPGSSRLYSWNLETHGFELLSDIPSSWPSSVKWFYADGILYLAVANEMSLVDLVNEDYSEPITFFRFEKVTKQLSWYQDFNLHRVVDLEAFTIGDELYLLAVSRLTDELYVLQWKGYSKFQTVQKYSVPLIRDVHVYWTSENEVHLAVASECQITIFKAVMEGSGLVTEDGRFYGDGWLDPESSS